MKKSTGWMRQIAGVGGVALALAVIGCATPRLSDVTTVADDDAAYLVFGAQGLRSKQVAVGQRIVGQAYEQVKRRRPADTAGPLDAWTDFLTSLETPITIGTETYRKAPELRNIRDIDLVATYIRQNPDALRLEGAAWLTAWSEDLEQARTVVESLKKAVTAARRGAVQAVKKGDLSAAYELILQAYVIAPNEAVVRRETQGIQDALAKSVVSDLTQHVEDLSALARDFGTEKSELSKLGGAEVGLSSALDRLAILNQGMAAHRVPFSERDTGTKLAELQAKALELSGATWAEAIRLRTRAADYWGAYQSTVETLARIEANPRLSGTPAASQVVSAYAEMLPSGMQDLLEQANSLFYSDRFGLAYIASRMSRELYDYAGRLGLDERDPLTIQAQQADQTAADSSVRIRSLIARRLLVADFVPAVTEDYENLGFQIRTRLRYLTAPGNNLAWGLEVPAPTSLPPDSQADRGPRDLFYSGSMEKKVSVDALPSVERERGFVAVGTDRINEVPNPLHGLQEGAGRLAYSQEVHLYPWVKTLHRKQARIALRVVREVETGAPKVVYELDETFPNSRMHFTNLSVESEALVYQPFILGTPRLAASRSELTITDPPTGQSIELAPDDEIKRAVIHYVLEAILAAMDRDAAQFPVESIAATAHEHQTQNRPLEAAENWGHFLAYMHVLVSADLAEEDDWMDRRTTIQESILAWRKDRWDQQPDELLDALPRAWERAVEAYRAAEF